MEWGTRLESLKNEKNATVYTALNTWPIYVESHSLTISWRVSMSIMDFKDGLKGRWIVYLGFYVAFNTVQVISRRERDGGG